MLPEDYQKNIQAYGTHDTSQHSGVAELVDVPEFVGCEA
jgi:hypothetical protein